MILYPAIDIKNGKCVRLQQGQFNQIQVYYDNPVEVALQWEKCKATYLHLVDLDGALAGYRVNEEVIKDIVKNVSIPVQIGGGIRSIRDIENYLNIGIARVIIGTKAVENPEFVKECIHVFGAEKIVVGIDAKDGYAAVAGWKQTSTCDAVTLAKQMEQMGVKYIVYTDIAKDGMLQGPNLTYTKKMVAAGNLKIIASGGVSSMKDLDNLNEINAYGAIIGKALYEKKIELDKAVALFSKEEA